MSDIKPKIECEGQPYFDEAVLLRPRKPGILEYEVWKALGTDEEYIRFHTLPDGRVATETISKRIPPPILIGYNRFRLNWKQVPCSA